MIAMPNAVSEILALDERLEKYKRALVEGIVKGYRKGESPELDLGDGTKVIFSFLDNTDNTEIKVTWIYSKEETHYSEQVEKLLDEIACIVGSELSK